MPEKSRTRRIIEMPEAGGARSQARLPARRSFGGTPADRRRCALAPQCANRREVAKRRCHARGLLYAGDPSSGQTFRPAGRGRRCLVHRPARRGAGLSRAERRRQIDDDEDDHRLSRADRRHRDRLRPRHRQGADRGQAPHRLSARGRSRLSRHDARRVSRLHRPHPRLLRPRGPARASAGWSR